MDPICFPELMQFYILDKPLNLSTTVKGEYKNRE